MNLIIYYIDDKIDDDIDDVLFECSKDVGKLNGLLSDHNKIDELIYKDVKVDGLEAIVGYIVDEFYNKNNIADIILLDYKLYEDHNDSARFTGEQIYQLLKKLTNADILIITSNNDNVETINSLDKELNYYCEYMTKNIIVGENDIFSEEFIYYISKILDGKKFVEQTIELSKQAVKNTLKDEDKVKTITDLLDKTEFSGLTDKKIDTLLKSVNDLIEKNRSTNE